MESKYRAARVLELLALGLRVCASWSRVLLKGVFSVHVAPTPEGRRRVLTIFWGLASGDSLLLHIGEIRCNPGVGGVGDPRASVLCCATKHPQVSKCCLFLRSHRRLPTCCACTVKNISGKNSIYYLYCISNFYTLAKMMDNSCNPPLNLKVFFYVRLTTNSFYDMQHNYLCTPVQNSHFQGFAAAMAHSFVILVWQ